MTRTHAEKTNSEHSHDDKDGQAPASADGVGRGENPATPQHHDEVRAGPGDAGASDAPRRLPESRRTVKRRKSANKLIVALLIGTVAIVLLLALF